MAYDNRLGWRDQYSFTVNGKAVVVQASMAIDDKKLTKMVWRAINAKTKTSQPGPLRVTIKG